MALPSWKRRGVGMGYLTTITAAAQRLPALGPFTRILLIELSHDPVQRRRAPLRPADVMAGRGRTPEHLERPAFEAVGQPATKREPYFDRPFAAMLGHAAGSVASRYVHLDEAVQSAVERVSAEIAGLLDGVEAPSQAPSAQILEFNRGFVLGGSYAFDGRVTIHRAG